MSRNQIDKLVIGQNHKDIKDVRRICRYSSVSILLKAPFGCMQHLLVSGARDCLPVLFCGPPLICLKIWHTQ